MKTRVASTEVGIVVPTLGTRPEYLAASINSVRMNGDVHVCLVGPEAVKLSALRAQCDSFVLDTGKGLAAAINAGIASLPESVRFVNWLGDDDVLTPGGITTLATAVSMQRDAVLAYGHCRYIDASGTTLFTVRPSRWAESLLRFGPQLISQPAMLFRRNIFQQIGGLDEQLGWAFDLDLLIKLRQQGRFVAVRQVVASYRWHESALTVGSRKDSVREASVVRKRHLPPIARPLSRLWEPLVRRVVLCAGVLLTRRHSKAL